MQRDTTSLSLSGSNSGVDSDGIMELVPKFISHAGEPGNAANSCDDDYHQGPFTNEAAECSAPTSSPDVPASNNLETILQDESSSTPYNIPLQYLKEITNNFSDERILGRGGTGVVYKGVLQNGKMLAVKRIMPSLMSGLQKQFESEVYHIMELKHTNIVQCRGYCYETHYECLEHNGKRVFAERTERLVCFDYMLMGSLDKYLSDASSGLDWSTRYNIIWGICCGLCHLHEEIRTPIIHLDLKPQNILLDEGMVPKITDFGLSRLDQQCTICTSSREGTFGYMAPEFLHGGIITSKSDIFSLGVIILEVVTGGKDYPGLTKILPDEFIEHALGKWRNVLRRSPENASLAKYCKQINRCMKIGLMCVHPDRNKRPPMVRIIHMLQEGFESIESMTPVRPTKQSQKNFEDRQLQRYSATTGGPIVIGSIPYRYRARAGFPAKLEVLVISSRQGHGMKFPKSGWMLDQSMDEAAQRCALMLAGVCGETGPLLGCWVYPRRHEDHPCEAYMFPLRVTDELEMWPEMASRTRTWETVTRLISGCKYWWWMREALQRLDARHAAEATL